jgi:hypothetical protein
VEAMMTPDEPSSLMEKSDVVIAHTHIGSALMTFDASKSPILVTPA